MLFSSPSSSSSSVDLGHLNVLTCSQLAFLEHPLLVLVVPDFMSINVGVILPGAPDEIIDLIVSEGEEDFLDLELLTLDLLRYNYC
jgi:hypothetical protein